MKGALTAGPGAERTGKGTNYPRKKKVPRKNGHPRQDPVWGEKKTIRKETEKKLDGEGGYQRGRIEEAKVWERRTHEEKRGRQRLSDRPGKAEKRSIGGGRGAKGRGP